MTYALYGVAAFYALWVFYLAIMSLKRAKDAGNLSKITFVIATPLLLFGAGLDVFLQHTLCSVFFWDWPRKGEWTMSQRFSRYITERDDWREIISRKVCKKFLDMADPSGVHCKNKKEA